MSTPTAAKPDRTWLYVAIGFIVAWGILLMVFKPGGQPLLEISGAHGNAEFGWRLLDLDDKPVEFSRFKGKAIFLNVWATWCPPCVAEMPSIAALAANPRLKDVAFVCVATDESTEDVKRFLAGKNLPMTVLRATDVPPVFTTEGIPATFIITPDGLIDVAEVGGQDWNTPKVISLLEDLSASAKP